MPRVPLFLLLALQTGYAVEDASALLQTNEKAEMWPFNNMFGSSPNLPHPSNYQDLVLMHIPYNFGHTVESVALLPTFMRDQIAMTKKMFVKASQSAGVGGDSSSVGALNLMKKPSGVAWGHFNMDLQGKNEKTGCDTYFTPPKYWPEEQAKKYFGNKTVFGMLRDPYERIVAMFRGNIKGYGDVDDELHDSCDVNAGVKTILKRYLSGEDRFAAECTFLPQAEYFEGKYGITLPIDNRKFPQSMNAVLKAHHYPWDIRQADVFHVSDCVDTWAGDLDEEARALVRKVYAKDFELLCKHFGYCDQEENCCIQGVHEMCPPKLFDWNENANYYVPKAGKKAANVAEAPVLRSGTSAGTTHSAATDSATTHRRTVPMGQVYPEQERTEERIAEPTSPAHHEHEQERRRELPLRERPEFQNGQVEDIAAEQKLAARTEMMEQFRGARIPYR